MSTTNEAAVSKSTIRAMRRSDDSVVQVLSDPTPGNPMFAVFESNTKSVPVYRKGDTYLDGRAIGDISSTGVVLIGEANSVAFLKYKDLINLKVSNEAPKVEIAETVAPHGKSGSGKK